MSLARSLFVIDTLDRVSFMSATALELVRGCGGAWLAEISLGRRIWDSIPGFENQQLFELLYDRVRSVGASLSISLRCDSNAVRRLASLELRPLADGSVQHLVHLQWSKERVPLVLLDPRRQRDARSLNCCTWCKCIQIGQGAWEEIEAAEAILHIKDDPTLPELRASVCVACKQNLLQTYPARVA